MGSVVRLYVQYICVDAPDRLIGAKSDFSSLPCGSSSVQSHQAVLLVEYQNPYIDGQRGWSLTIQMVYFPHICSNRKCYYTFMHHTAMSSLTDRRTYEVRFQKCVCYALKIITTLNYLFKWVRFWSLTRATDFQIWTLINRVEGPLSGVSSDDGPVPYVVTSPAAQFSLWSGFKKNGRVWEICGSATEMRAEKYWQD